MKNSEADVSGTVFDRLRLSIDTCFLCGCDLSDNKTREHVFPKWLQHRHDLWKQKLTLLNGTPIPYQKLTIPCCSDCNNEHLASLERRVQNAVEKGYSACRDLEPLVLYQWMGKIFYGILRKELTLLLDRVDHDKGTIVPSDLIEGFSTLHLFLQSIRQPFEFPDGIHFSALVAHLHTYSDKNVFDFHDSLELTVCRLQTREIGFIVALQDVNLLAKTYGNYLDKVNGRRLAPIQFDELYARCVYQVSLLNRIPKFVTATTKDPKEITRVHMLPIAGLSSIPVVSEWNQEDYASVLCDCLSLRFKQVPLDKVFVPPNQVMSWMSDENGELKLSDQDEARQW